MPRVQSAAVTALCKKSESLYMSIRMSVNRPWIRPSLPHWLEASAPGAIARYRLRPPSDSIRYGQARNGTDDVIVVKAWTGSSEGVDEQDFRRLDAFSAGCQTSMSTGRPASKPHRRSVAVQLQQRRRESNDHPPIRLEEKSEEDFTPAKLRDLLRPARRRESESAPLTTFSDRWRCLQMCLSDRACGCGLMSHRRLVDSSNSARSPGCSY